MANPGAATLGRAIGLHQAGRIGEALRLLESVLAAEPRNLLALQHVAIIHANRGEFAKAENLFRQALAIDPQSAENHSNLGRIQVALNQHQRALDSLRRALALRPGMLEAEFNLGALHLKLGQREEGMVCLRRALENRPDFSDALCLLAGAMNEQGDGPEALTLLEGAISRHPQDAGLHHALGRIHADRGEFERARTCFEAAIDRRPGWGVPYYDLSLFHRFAPDDRRVAAMERLLRDPAQLSLEGRIGLHMAVYKALAGAGRYDDAFSHLRDANRARRATIKYDEAARKKRGQAIRRIFDAKFLGDRVGHGHASPGPIFVLGFPRSGTTLVEQLLASHPAIHGAGELLYLGETIEQAANTGPSAARYPECLMGAEPEAFARLGLAYDDRLRRLAPAALRIVDKMPINYLHVGFIHLILPQAKIIHVRRDAMDTCFSCFDNDFGSRQAYSYDLGELGRCYADYRETMAHWREVLPAGKMLEVAYEELVSDFEAQARRLVHYCELPWDDRCLRFHETERAVFTQSQAQVRRPLYSSSVGRWKPYAGHLAALAAALQSPANRPENELPRDAGGPPA
jgi:tetratricopeptide (TPR) repeat protein